MEVLILKKQNTKVPLTSLGAKQGEKTLAKLPVFLDNDSNVFTDFLQHTNRIAIFTVQSVCVKIRYWGCSSLNRVLA